MAICGGITEGAEYDCTDPVQANMISDIVLINQDDIESISYDVNGRVDDITLKPGKQAYLFEGIRQSANAQVELTEVALTVGYTHIVNFTVFDISTDQKINLEKLALGKVICITLSDNIPGNLLYLLTLQ